MKSARIFLIPFTSPLPVGATTSQVLKIQSDPCLFTEKLLSKRPGLRLVGPGSESIHQAKVDFPLAEAIPLAQSVIDSHQPGSGVYPQAEAEA